MPQPRNRTPDTPPAAKRAVSPNPTDPAQYEGLSDDGANEFVTRLLNKAEELRTERADVLKRQGANREVLRSVKLTGELSEKQAKAIDLFYPPRDKGDSSNGDAPADNATGNAPAENATTNA